MNEPGSPEPAGSSNLTLVSVSRRAMATLFEILTPQGEPEITSAASQALDLVDQLEEQLSVYRDDSELSILNRRADLGAVEVETKLFQLFEYAARLTRETQGAFDVATGALTKIWGFYHREGRLPSVAERIDAMGKVGMRYVILDAERRAVRYLRKGLEINLGGIGKGYALDRAGDLLAQEWGVQSAILHGGSSSILALGAPPGQPMGWQVAIRHPWDPERSLGCVRLRGQALGTSAATHQHFEHNGKKLGHLLDPRTGSPAERMLQASVVAPTATEADALSTAFFVLGIEGATRYCKSHPTIGAILLPIGADAKPVVLNTTLSAEF